MGNVFRKEPVTVTVVTRGYFKDEDDTAFGVECRDDDDFQEFLKDQGAGGLVLLEEATGGDDEDEQQLEQPDGDAIVGTSSLPSNSSAPGAKATPRPQAMLVRRFSSLIPSATYELFPGPTKKQKVLGESTHLRQGREVEGGRALCNELAKLYPSEGFVQRDDLRVLKGKAGKEYEHDPVVVGHTMAYVASMKTYVKSTRPAGDIADRAEELGELSQQPEMKDSLNAQLLQNVRAAFMAERIEPRLAANINKLCLYRKVMRLQRCGGAICIVNRAAGTGSRMRLF